MNFLKKFFKKKEKQDAYSLMGSLGVSPQYMLMYKDSIKKIKKEVK